MKGRRAEMSGQAIESASEAIHEHLFSIEQLCDAQRVFCYVSSRNEPGTHSLIQKLLVQGKHVSVPRIEPDGVMRAHLIQSLDNLQPGGADQFNLRVPPAESPIENEPEVTIVPGLAFTRAGQRLGMGGGHYDRFLAEHPGTFSIGLCYDWQIVHNVPVDPHDRSIRYVVSEAQLIICL